MTTVEALHELRRMAQPVCWRCEGKGHARRYGQYRDGSTCIVTVRCWSCNGTGAPERAA